MKKFGLFLLLSAFCIALRGADVFVLKPVKFQYPGVLEVLKKVVAEGEAALPAETSKVELHAAYNAGDQRHTHQHHRYCNSFERCEFFLQKQHREQKNIDGRRIHQHHRCGDSGVLHSRIVKECRHKHKYAAEGKKAKLLQRGFEQLFICNQCKKAKCHSGNNAPHGCHLHGAESVRTQQANKNPRCAKQKAR